MIRETFGSSPEMGKSAPKENKTAKYPWRTMEIGTSFAVGKDEAKLGTLRSRCWKMGKKLGKKFSVVDHGDKGFEVGRVV